MRQAIYLVGWAQNGRDLAVGDGITRPAIALVGVVTDGVDSDELLERCRYRSRNARHPNGRPLLAVGDYDPLDYVPGQNKWQYNRIDTHARIIREAKARRRELGLAR